MSRKLIGILLCLILMSPMGDCVAASISVPKQEIYENGKLLVVLKQYEEALQRFEQLGSYQDCIKWKYYCEGMISIYKASEKESGGCISEAKQLIETAYQRFRMLSSNKFENSEQMEVYCTARLYELKGLNQSALDLYASLLGTEDSDERYLRLLDGIPLPTQAPNCETGIQMLPAIPAHTNRSIEALMGPGSDYAKQKHVSLKTETPCFICAKEGNYYLIDLTTEIGKIRCWVSTLRIQRDENKKEPEIGKKKRNGYMLEPQNGLYGPGADYAESGTLIPAGTKILVYDAEGSYTMIELYSLDENALMRLWVPTDSISK